MSGGHRLCHPSTQREARVLLYSSFVSWPGHWLHGKYQSSEDDDHSWLILDTDGLLQSKRKRKPSDQTLNHVLRNMFCTLFFSLHALFGCKIFSFFSLFLLGEKNIYFMRTYFFSYVYMCVCVCVCVFLMQKNANRIIIALVPLTLYFC